MFAASPVLDCSIVVASSCPSTKTRPATSWTSRSAGTAPRRRSSHRRRGSGSGRSEAPLGNRAWTASTISNSARSFRKPASCPRVHRARRRRHPGLMREPGTAHDSPASRSRCGAAACPTARPEPSKQTPISSSDSPARASCVGDPCTQPAKAGATPGVLTPDYPDRRRCGQPARRTSGSVAPTDRTSARGLLLHRRTGGRAVVIRLLNYGANSRPSTSSRPCRPTTDRSAKRL